MKKVLLVILLVLALAFTLVACEPDETQNPPQTEHSHSFGDNWTRDENCHWHAATCEHTDVTADKASHNLVPVPGDTRLECDVCGYSKSTSNPKPEPPHEHTFATEYSADKHSHWLETTCGHEVENGAPHHFVDGICDTCGWWSSATDVLFANLSKSELWDFTVLLDDVVINNYVNLLSEDSEPAKINVSGELKLSMSADGQIEGCGYIQTDGLFLKAVVKDATVYACGDGNYIRCALSEALAQVGIDVDELSAYVDELNANTQQIREYVEQIKQTVEQLPVDGLITDGMLSALVKTDETKSTDNLTVYVVDYEVLRTVNRALATVTVEQYVNGALQGLSDTPLGVLLGDSFNGLPAKIRTLLAVPIGQTLLELRFNNYSLDDLLKQINGIVADYYPDKDVNNLDELLAAMGVDLKGLTVKESILAASLFSPETLWNNIQEDEDKKISAKEISDNLAEWCNEYGDKTVYQIVAENNDELTDGYIELFVEGIADMLDEYLSIEFYVDSDGVLQQITVAVAENAEQQLFDNFSGTITLKRDYESTQDYSKVIEQVNAVRDIVKVPEGQEKVDELVKQIISKTNSEDITVTNVNVNGDSVTIEYKQTRLEFLTTATVNSINTVFAAQYDINYDVTINFDNAPLFITKVSDNYLVIDLYYTVDSSDYTHVICMYPYGGNPFERVVDEDGAVLNSLLQEGEQLQDFNLQAKLSECESRIKTIRHAKLFCNYFDSGYVQFVPATWVNYPKDYANEVDKLDANEMPDGFFDETKNWQQYFDFSYDNPNFSYETGSEENEQLFAEIISGQKDYRQYLGWFSSNSDYIYRYNEERLKCAQQVLTCGRFTQELRDKYFGFYVANSTIPHLTALGKNGDSIAVQFNEDWTVKSVTKTTRYAYKNVGYAEWFVSLIGYTLGAVEKNYDGEFTQMDCMLDAVYNSDGEFVGYRASFIALYLDVEALDGREIRCSVTVSYYDELQNSGVWNGQKCMWEYVEYTSKCFITAYDVYGYPNVNKFDTIRIYTKLNGVYDLETVWNCLRERALKLSANGTGLASSVVYELV